MALTRTRAVRARHLLALLALAAAAAVCGHATPATAHGSDDCDPRDPVCYDALPPNTVWEQAIGLDAVDGSYGGNEGAVALVDTGVTPNDDLGSRLLARVDLTREHDGIDRFGHGSHMAGLIAGDGSRSERAFEGAAPDARLVSLKVAGWDGATDVSTVIAAIQWVVSHRARYDIRVLNLSFGTDATGSYGADALNAAVERAWRSGIVVVVAAGNRGTGLGSTISKPGDDPYVITVGAADIHDTATAADDTVAPFSSRGPTVDGVGKPDILAPGVSLVSTRAPGSTIDAFRPAARLGDAYFKGSGTSQATAVVSGVVARMLEANETLTPDQVKGVLMATARPGLAGPAGGAGMINAAAAVRAVAIESGDAPRRLPKANAGLVPSTGRGKLEASRGRRHVYLDLTGDGVADELKGDIDALGRPWDREAFATTAWTPETWARSPWARVTAEILGPSEAPPWSGPPLAPLAWEAKYWGADSWTDAGWTAKYWGAKYWGAKYWGTGMWQ